MAAIIVTYDLRTPDQKYNELIEAIKKYSWGKLSESCWIINTESKCSEVRDNLKQFIDENDRLFVATLSGEAAWQNTILGNDSVIKRLNQ